MNWSIVAKSTFVLLVSQAAIGFSESFWPMSLAVLVAGFIASFLTGTAVFAHMSYRQCDHPYMHAWAVLVLHSFLGTALLLAVPGTSALTIPPLLLPDLAVLIAALVIGTALGSLLGRGTRRSADA